jgi:hypothetical protein
MPSECTSPCQTCGNKASECRSCFLPSPNPFLLSVQCVNKCPDGFFKSILSASCEPCHPRCSQCSGPSASECLKCDPSLYFSEFRCLTTCPGQTIPSDILISNTSDKFCARNRSCDLTCLTCGVDPKLCFVCQPNWSLDPISRRCFNNERCSSGYFFNPISKTCDSCTINCATCQGLAENCTSCPTYTYNQFLNMGLCVESCPTGLFSDELMNCKRCSNNCATCQKTNDYCTSCPTNTTGKFLEYGTCLSNCSSGMVLKGTPTEPLCRMNCTSPSCLKCSSNSLGTCEVCDPKFPVLRFGECMNETSLCPVPGTFVPNYVGSSRCEKCSSDCRTCSGSASNCTSCVNSLNSWKTVNFTLSSPVPVRGEMLQSVP